MRRTAPAGSLNVCLFVFTDNLSFLTPTRSFFERTAALLTEQANGVKGTFLRDIGRIAEAVKHPLGGESQVFPSVARHAK